MRRAFRPADLDGAWLVVAAAPPEVNREVRAAAEQRGVFVNAVDNPETCSAYAGGVLTRGGVTVAVSSNGEAPALAGLLREALETRAARGPGALAGRGARPAQEVARGGRAHEEAPAAAAAGPERALRGDAAMSGLVSLVGAGPGDPDLLTRKAAQRLAEADLVLYDALVDPAVLELAGKAQRFYVGKRAGRHHVTQEQIHRILIRAAQARPARGAPQGRGSVRVRPRRRGSARPAPRPASPSRSCPASAPSVAAPALAGIPVTHRGMSTGFVVVSGHAESAWRPALDSLAPGAVTVVVLMGLAHRGAIAARLLARGWTRAHAGRHRVGRLARRKARPGAARWPTLAAATSPSDGVRGLAPGTIVVGAVVSLAEALAPAASHPITAAGGSR